MKSKRVCCSFRSFSFNFNENKSLFRIIRFVAIMNIIHFPYTFLSTLESTIGCYSLKICVLILYTNNL